MRRLLASTALSKPKISLPEGTLYILDPQSQQGIAAVLRLTGWTTIKPKVERRYQWWEENVLVLYLSS